MSSTGRASILVGGSVLFGIMINAHLDRVATDARAAADRSHSDLQKQKERAYQNYQDSYKQYVQTPFYKQKGKKPVWDEASWDDWSKTK